MHDANEVVMAFRIIPGLVDISDYLQKLCPVDYEIIETAPVLRPSDAISQRGDATKINAGWGWEPAIPWRQTVDDVWKNHVGFNIN